MLNLKINNNNNSKKVILMIKLLKEIGNGSLHPSEEKSENDLSDFCQEFK